MPFLDRRSLLKLMASAAAASLRGRGATPPEARKLVLVTIGGIRRQESFSEAGRGNIPRLAEDLLPQSLFYPFMVNEGVTSHFNTIASILTGCWQHVDDWGSERPTDPTLFRYLKNNRATGPNDLWVVTSNKQVTANISPDSNVVLSKQLLIEAVERIIMGDSSRKRLEREQLLDEMKAVLETDYERIGWGAQASSVFRDPEVKKTFVGALSQFIHGPGAPVSGDELTFIVAREVLSRLRPAMLMVNFSDVEVAHSGAYSLHVGAIRRTDSLCHRLWEAIRTDPALSASTTLVLMNEFGRDPDGSTTNGFFNHRSNTESCRMAWSMVLGAAAAQPAIKERVVRQIDMAPTVGRWMGVECAQAKGRMLDGFKA
jgi:hypothetical protein